MARATYITLIILSILPLVHIPPEPEDQILAQHICVEYRRLPISADLEGASRAVRTSPHSSIVESSNLIQQYRRSFMRRKSNATLSAPTRSHPLQLPMASAHSESDHQADLDRGTSITTPAPIAPEESHLFRLPAELRNQIYEYVFHSAPTATFEVTRKRTAFFRPANGLIMTSKAIRKETLQMHYTMTPLYVSISCVMDPKLAIAALTKWSAAMDKSCLDWWIRIVHVDYHTCNKFREPHELLVKACVELFHASSRLYDLTNFWPYRPFHCEKKMLKYGAQRRLGLHC